jgi:4-amino-4-deoxy-L-arabinose transferase-like glycosyltransferase
VNAILDFAVFRKPPRYLLELVLIGLACAALLPGLGRTYLWDPDEPRFAAASRHMLAHGDYLAPVFNDEPRWEKPILLYWLQVGAFRAFGVSEWAARLPSALAGAACVALIFILGRDLFSAPAGLVAAALWLSTFRFVMFARQGLTDVPVLACVLLAMVCFARAAGLHAAQRTNARGTRHAAWLGWLAVGLGVLMKGPVGLLPCVVITAWILLTREWSLVRPLRFGTGPLLAALVALPWYAYAIAVNGAAFLSIYVGHELVARAVSTEFGGSRRGPLFYLGIAPGEIAPWTLLVAGAIVWTIVWWGQASQAERRTLGLLGAWVVTVFAVFSMARFKLPHYVLPAYPPLLLLTGAFVDGARATRSWRLVLRASLVATALLLVTGIAILAWIRTVVLPDAAVNAPVFTVLAIAIAIGGLAAWQNRIDAALILTAAPAALVYAVIAAAWGNDIRNHFQPAQALGLAQMRQAASAPLATIGPWPSLVYYAGRHVTFLPDVEAAVRWIERPGPHLLVLREREANLLRSAAPGWRGTELARHPMFAPRLKHILDGRAMRPSDHLVLLTDSVGP